MDHVGGPGGQMPAERSGTIPNVAGRVVDDQDAGRAYMRRATRASAYRWAGKAEDPFRFFGDGFQAGGSEPERRKGDRRAGKDRRSND